MGNLDMITDHQTELQKKTYRQEAFERLVDLETALLELEETPDDENLIDQTFRSLHTIKGSGAMFGFNAIAAFTHEVETAYDLVRSGRMPVSKALISLSLSAKDLITEMLNSRDDNSSVDPERAAQIISGLKRLIPADADTKKSPKEDHQNREDEASVSGTGPMVTYRIRFQPAPDIFSFGTNPLLMFKELEDLGECHVVSHNNAIPLLTDYAPERCYVFWDIILTTDKDLSAIEDVFIFVSDDSRVSICVIDEEDVADAPDDYKKIGEILVERGDLSIDEIERLTEGKKRIGELLTEAGMVTPDVVESALVEQAHIKKIRQQRMEKENRATLRVDAQKLDILVDLVGELVTVQARLNQEAPLSQNSNIVAIAEEVERLVSELRDNTMSIRMRPIGTAFNRFKRLVRDLSNTLGKQIVLATEGGETELDKTVLERLNDPLVHIIRNSIDHGIEMPEARTQAGKPRKGTIHLSAGHVGANVVIRITDDGAGLDAEAIHQTAIARGLVEPNSDMTEKETFDLLFIPGFSTAACVSDVSGRGVGMDVVKKNIEALRGNIDISSRKGEGTTISLELPLTLAIIDGFMVAIGDEHYVFPLTDVEECVEISGREMGDVHRRNIMNIRGAAVPYRNLRELFGINGTSGESERVVVVKSGGQKIGFGVDRVIGHHQTVIKSLGRMYQNISGLSGATILGDGTVAVILDVPQMISEAEKNGAALRPYQL